MNPLAVLWRKTTDVFHIRMGGCSGCADMVDSLLRDGRWPGRLQECSSPRHAELIIISGLWTPGLADAASRVISQAPASCRIMLLGDCALGVGFFSGRAGRDTEAGPAEGIELAGCPVVPAALEEAVRRVKR